MRLNTSPPWNRFTVTRANIQQLDPAPYTLHPAPHTLHPAPHTLHPAPHTLHPAPHTPHPAPYTLHLAPSTLHPPPYTLHPTPHTLHPSPNALHPTPDTLQFNPLSWRSLALDEMVTRGNVEELDPTRVINLLVPLSASSSSLLSILELSDAQVYEP